MNNYKHILLITKLTMKVFPIANIPIFSKKDRIVVVGVIGKSAYRYPNKTTPLLPSVQAEENGIECYWDEHRSILFLHAVTYLDTKRLVELSTNLDENSKSTEKDADAAHWLVASGELAADSCRIMSLLFQLCHIVVLSSPTSTFDLGYLQLFKAIDAYRNELTPRITTALSDIGATGAWETHGRLCCPRLLFHFRRAPAPLRHNPAALKRLEHATEDQLYFILRKTRIITNVCAKSLFAVPKNEEFVYISAENSEGNARDVSALVRGLVQACTGAESGPPPPPSPRAAFRAFLQGHVDRAFHEGFDDNVGKYAMSTSFFELPSASSWRAAAQALTPVFLEEVSTTPKEEDDESEPSGALYETLATDVRFSAARCAKVLPIALASYGKGLPSHYSSQHHAHKVCVALGVLGRKARGPLSGGAAGRLRAACRAAWRSRTLCEALSLTGHGCIHPDHDGSKEHSSGVIYVSTCNCGRTRAQREDPYTARAANYGFYCLAAEQCSGCNSLEKHDFPVFEPSTPTFRAATVKPVSSQEAAVSTIRDSEGNTPTSEPGSDWSAPDALSPGPAKEEEEDEEEEQEEGYIVHVRGDSISEKTITRQPSTTEYLPGMLRADSPAGLLPAFPSWSLVCLGPSSLYSHAPGLPDHLQPGFLPHTNFLVPWDCAPRVEQMSLFRAAMGRGRGKSVPPHLTVKIFIGFEYECPRGHRFMMSSPESVASGCVSGREGAVRGARLAAADMPLRAACPCRAGAAPSPAPATPGPPPAHLARVHVVTPKAPLHVTLDPRVQPVPGGPIFVPMPSGSGPVKLSAAAYWILRLPYVYCDERGPLPRPRPRTAAAPASAPVAIGGKLIAPLFGLQD